MMKFNQIVRASVLSLTLVAGGLCASHALAYDQADIDNATSDYYERTSAVAFLQGLIGSAEAQVAYDSQVVENDRAQYASNYAAYEGDQAACWMWLHTFMQDQIGQCLGDAYNTYLDRNAQTDIQVQIDESILFTDSSELTGLQAELADAQSLLETAIAWLSTVTNGQNGQHGVP